MLIKCLFIKKEVNACYYAYCKWIYQILFSFWSSNEFVFLFLTSFETPFNIFHIKSWFDDLGNFYFIKLIKLNLPDNLQVYCIHLNNMRSIHIINCCKTVPWKKRGNFRLFHIKLETKMGDRRRIFCCVMPDKSAWFWLNKSRSPMATNACMLESVIFFLNLEPR